MYVIIAALIRVPKLSRTIGETKFNKIYLNRTSQYCRIERGTGVKLKIEIPYTVNFLPKTQVRFFFFVEKFGREKSTPKKRFPRSSFYENSKEIGGCHLSENRKIK